MTVRELKAVLANYPDDLPVRVVYDLNDWPGDTWDDLNATPEVTRPIDLTKTNSAVPGANDLSLIFDIR